MYRRMKQEFRRVLTNIGPLSVKVFALLTHIYGTVIVNEVITWATVFFFFSWHYSPLWGFAFLLIFFHSALSSHFFLHRLTPIICKSSSMSAIHLLLLSCIFQLPPLWCSRCQLAEECAHSRFQIALPYLTWSTVPSANLSARTEQKLR